MAQAIEMFFDEQADAAVRRLWRRLTDAGLPSLQTHSHGRHRPHVSLTVADPDPGLGPDILADLRTDLGGGHRLPLSFQGLGTFAGPGGVLFLALAPTAPLLALQERATTILRAHRVEPRPHYLPGTWVPHCTLAVGLAPSEVRSAIDVLGAPDPFDATVAGTGVTDTATGLVTDLG